MPLVFLPDSEALFLWGDDIALREAVAFGSAGKPARAELVTPDGRRAVDGLGLALLETLSELEQTLAHRKRELMAHG